jgi:nucleoside-diphosphate-sugar epimerase
VDDVAKATVLALENENAAGETFNVSSGKPTTINELVEIVKEFARCDLKVIYKEPRKGDVRHNYGDPAKAEKILGFKAMISLKDGLKQIANKYSSFHYSIQGNKFTLYAYLKAIFIQFITSC